jgi:hypothetical protein
MTESTWETVALPILEHVAAVEDDAGFRGILSVSELAAAINQPPTRVESDLHRLFEGGYLLGRMGAGFGEPDFMTMPRLSDLGARTVGKWPPNDPYELLLRLVEQRIDSAADDQERSRWQRVRAAITDVGKAGVAGLMVEATKAITGLNV